MLLERLVEFYERVKDNICPPRHAMRKLSWIIELSTEGEFRGYIPTDKEIPGAACYTAGTSPTPRLLVDKPEYALGLDLGDKGEEKVRGEHEAFRELLQECSEAVDSPDLLAVQKLLKNGMVEVHGQEPEDMSASDLVTFSVDGRLPACLEEVRSFWIAKMRLKAEEGSSRKGECMVCGLPDLPIADIHREEIPVDGGAKLISANKPAFESYGLSHSEVAPVCMLCSEKYGRALQELASSENHSLRVASTTHLYWTRGTNEFDPDDLISDPTDDEVSNLFKSTFRSGGPSDVDSDEFYTLSVSNRESRLVVRNWIETTVSEAKKSLASYFRMQRMVGPEGEDSFYPLRVLASSLSRDFDHIPAGAEDCLVACALRGTPLPDQILYQAIRRVRADADYRMTRPRAALMRLVFESQRSRGLLQEDSEVTATLDTDNSSPAYLCGRLLAVLENIQKAAVPGIKATLIDRYFGTASSAPATVFGSLLRSAQNHLAKLRKKENGSFKALDSQLQEICSELPPSEMPHTLSLRDQALFSLGYYQQKANDGQRAKENYEKKLEETKEA